MNVVRNVAFAMIAAGCSIPQDDAATTASEVDADPSDTVVAGATPAEVAAFNDGDEAFGLVFGRRRRARSPVHPAIVRGMPREGVARSRLGAEDGRRRA
jgi:hypothetical protein